MVKIISAAVAGIVGAAVGWAALAALVLAVAWAFAVADHDGGLAMMAFFAVGPFGGLVGFVAGSIVALRSSRHPSTSAVFTRLPLVAIAAAAIVGGVAAVVWNSRPLTAPGGLPPELLFEIRLPPGTPPPAAVSRSDALARRSPIELVTTQNTMSAQIDSSRTDDGRAIIAGRVELHYRVADRLLVLRPPGASVDVRFAVQVGRSPVPSDEFGPWKPDLDGRNFEARIKVVAGAGGT